MPQKKLPSPYLYELGEPFFRWRNPTVRLCKTVGTANFSAEPFCKVIYAVVSSSLTDGIEFPYTVVAVYLAEYHSSHIVIILGEIVFAELLTVFVAYTDECIADHTEVLLALSCLIDVHDEHYLVVFGRKSLEVDKYLLIVAVAGTCEVVAHMLDAFAAVVEIAVINYIGIAYELAVFAGNSRSIAVYISRCAAEERGKESAAALLRFIPAETYHYLGELSAGILAKVDLLTFN